LKNAFLVGKKTYLRGLEETDLENIQKWLCDEKITYHLFQGDLPPNLDRMKNEYQKLISNHKDIVFAIISNENDLHIGWTGIYEINWISRNGELRFFIGDSKYHKKGIATEVVSLLIKYAFDKLNLHKVYGGTNKENLGSVKIFEKLGFEKEGTSKEGHFRNGKYYDLIRFGLINK